jgi:hypothetical protein
MAVCPFSSDALARSRYSADIHELYTRLPNQVAKHVMLRRDNFVPAGKKSLDSLRRFGRRLRIGS